ncbi:MULTISPECIES: indole-3-glycerol-phosphate synthase TrpC [unclassified Actinomyces]|uniref:indole-3-glycerol phosphate synthase TrpC n=1 Tax=unclassified Actinomyces TaxID=2609248 RepID=UPI002018323F|nr:indole-3-glycerol-phosphate synthase TrpC [Actinomyces sp. 187325]MCL3777514.1 indole-3-glycerol-phosphate synthase TrpC [Actinomyces sp. AC-20-1]MCL3790086.1 indole-3-glycerol-phosphate synthase TrpC [Actinomyces sp. 187325]MCL3792371.1 indole-3-glycerol-phosphate synthase TrpC [Actinomyces sp. 186855]MCL3794123.1 indole-3-glycerol-phosphate synthase TrpC [Actinomyces sp. 217892]
MIDFPELAAAARAAVAEREQRVSLDALREAARQVPSSADAARALRSQGRAVSVIAEVKRATATFADLSGVGDVAVLARFYEAGGAACVSVVTEPTHAHGDLADLDAVRRAVDVPVMVNDVVVTPYQVHEARAHGADLLMLDARLETIVLESLIERTHSLGMLAVVEAHSRCEALTAVEAGARAIFVDARDPASRRVDRSRFEQVAELLPSSVIRIAGGGVAGARDVMTYARTGADVVLVGEALIRSADPQQSVAELVAAGSHPSLLNAVHREAL